MPPYPRPYTGSPAGGSPRDLTDDQVILDQLLGAEAGIAQRGGETQTSSNVGTVMPDPRARITVESPQEAATRSAAQQVDTAEPIPVRQADADPALWAEAQAQYAALPKAAKKSGIVDFVYKGKKYRFDTYQHYVDQGFTHDRNSGQFGNFLIRFGEEWTGRRRENLARRENDQRQLAAERLARDRIAADSAYKAAAIEARNRAIDAGDRNAAMGRATAIINTRQRAAVEKAKVEAYQERTRQTGAGKPVNPLDQARADYWKYRTQRAREGKPLGPDAPRGTAGGKTGLNTGTALLRSQKLEELMNEAQQNLQTLDDEIRGTGFFNFRAGNEDQIITINSQPRRVPAAQLKAAYEAEAQRLKRMQGDYDGLRKIIESGLDEGKDDTGEDDTEPPVGGDVPDYDPSEGDSLLEDEDGGTPPGEPAPGSKEYEDAVNQPALDFPTPEESGEAGGYETQVFHQVLQDLAASGLSVDDPVTQKAAYEMTKKILAEQGGGQ